MPIFDDQLIVIPPASGPAGFSDDFAINIKADDTNAAQTDDVTYAMSATYEDDIIETTPPVFHNASTQQTATAGSSRSVNRPTATVDGDLLIAYISFSAASGALTITPPAGWTQIGTTQSVRDTALGISITTGVYAKIASSEPASWNWTTGTNFDSASASCLAFTGGAIPTKFAVTSSATRDTSQTYGPVSGDVTGRHYIVGMTSLSQSHGQAGWSAGPPQLTDRTGDVSPTGSNNVDQQVWSGLNGSNNGLVTKTESDVWISFAVVVVSQPTAYTETVKLAFPAPDFADTSNAPTEANSFTLKAWLTGSAGTGVTNPGNANGSNDGAVATLQTAPAGTNPIVMTSNCGSGLPAGITLTNCTLYGFYKSVNSLVTSSTTIKVHSSTGLFSDITIFSNSALNTTVDHLTDNWGYDLFSAGVDTLAKAQSVQIICTTQDAAAGVSPAVLTVDAFNLTITGAFS